MKKQPEITAATRAAFIAAYYDLTLNKHHKKITIQSLADRAGFNRTTFYEYFKDINDLVASIEEDMLKIIRTKLLAHMGKSDLEEVFVTVFTELYTEYDAPLRLLFQDNNAPHFSQMIKQQLMPIFAERMPNSRTAETAYILEFYLSGVLSVVSRWFSQADDLSLEEFAHIMKSIVNGMNRSGLLNFS